MNYFRPSPTETVIFNPAQILPMYRVTFEGMARPPAPAPPAPAAADPAAADPDPLYDPDVVREMQIFVKHPFGNTITLEVDSSDGVDCVKVGPATNSPQLSSTHFIHTMVEVNSVSARRDLLV